MKKERNYCEAYFTVEASFIIPLSFLLIILTLYFGFFCYEKSITLQCCYLAALRSSNEWQLSGTWLEQYAEGELQSLIEEKQLYSMKTEYQIDVNITGVEVSVDEYIDIPFSSMRGDDITGWDINSSKKAVRNKPSSYIRKYQSIKK